MFNMSFLSQKLLNYFILCVIISEGISMTNANNTCTTRTTVISWFKYTTLKPNTVVVDVNKDAKAIVDSQNAPHVIASILPFRSQIQCQQINTQVVALAADKPLVPDGYVPCSTPDGQFNDLIFSIVQDENTVLSMFLGQMLANEDVILSTIILTLVKDMKAFQDVFSKTHQDKKLDESIDFEDDHVEDLFKMWIGHIRDADAPNSDVAAVEADAVKLIQEQPSWDSNRQLLDTIIFQKSYTYAKAVLQSYEVKSGGKLREHISATIQNPDIARVYSYQAAYILDKYAYMAELLKNHSDGSDHWVTWTIVIGVIHDNDLPLVKQAFTKVYQQTLADVILQVNADHAFLEMLAVLVSVCHELSFALMPATNN